MRTWLTVAGLVLILALAAGPVRGALEASMAGQMLIQMPLLVVAGLVLAAAVPARSRQAIEAWNAGGVPGLLLVGFVSAYWMLPRALDAALENGLIETAKFLSLPLLLGVPLGLSWSRLHSVLKGFFLANLLSMLAVVGWLYRSAPVRVCSYYLTDQQVITGDALIAVSAIAALVWLGGALTGGFSRSAVSARLERPQGPAVGVDW